MNQEELTKLAKDIVKVAHLKGDFLLRSGKKSNEYFDKYRFEALPHILKRVATYSKSFIEEKHEALAGLETGGIPLATALSLESGLPSCCVRKEPKTYGTCQFAEGLDISGKNLLVIEDVVTTGGQLKISIKNLRDSGAIIETALCVILRGHETHTPQAFKEELNVDLKWLFTKEDLLARAAATVRTACV